MTRAELASVVAQHVWEHHGIEAPIDGKYLGRLERGEVRWPNARYRQALRDILGVPSDESLGFYCANAERMAKELTPVNRRSFLGVAAAGVVIAGGDRPWGRRDAPDGDPAADTDVESAFEQLEQLERGDATLGGGARLLEAEGLYERVTARRNAGSLSWHDDRALSRLQGDLGAWVGWLAYDAADLARAREYLTETIVHAHTSDHPEIEVRAMSYLCLLLSRTGRHRDALHCAEAGQRIASATAPRRVRALLHMRAAAAHAGLGDVTACRRSLASSYRDYEGRQGSGDPLWARFVTRSELDGLRGHALALLGDHPNAVAAFRSITDNPDPRYRRNGAYYSARLAESLLAEGDVAGASGEALAVVPSARALRSERVVTILRGVRDGVEPYRRQVPAARDFSDAYQEMLSA
jgi:hypothetical protein